MEDPAPPPGGSPRELVRWSETLAAIARTGLGFSENLYERERFQEVLNVAADIKAAANQVLDVDVSEAIEVAREQDHFVQVAQNRDEVGNEIDRRECVGCDHSREHSPVPRHARIAGRKVENDGIPPDGPRPSLKPV